jgi:broad specificity phosphatase PhoE
MRQVYVLRHANWNLNKDSLTDEGKQKCLDLKEKLGNFDIVISSNFDRNKETAKLLTGKKPQVDERAGILKLTDAQNQKITELRQKHPFGVAGAIFSIPELIEPVKKAGQNLIELIKEISSKLPKNGRALIISHDGTMVSAEKILKKDTFASIEKTYYELEGFIIDSNLQMKQF